MMRRILPAAAVLMVMTSAAHAQTACTQQALSALLTSFADTAPAGSITPRTMRNFVCSSVLADASGNMIYPAGVLTFPGGMQTTGSAFVVTSAGDATAHSFTTAGPVAAGNATVTGAITTGAMTASGIITAASVVAPTVSAPITGELDLGNAADGIGIAILDSGGTTVNHLTVTPGVTTQGVELEAAGSDTNISLNVESKGTGSVMVSTAAGTLQFNVSNTASAVDYLNVTGSAAGSPGVVPITVLGTDSNINLTLSSKGTGAIQLDTHAGTPQFQVSDTASAVDFLSVTGGVTGTPGIVPLTVIGSDTNISLTLTTKGTGPLVLATGGGTQLNVSNTASAVDYLNVTGGATGSPGSITISAAGSDTDVNFILSPKGAGVLKLGNAASFTANGSVGTTMTSLGPTGSHTTVQEWLTVQDSAGTVRYIPAY
jgi:hypothetical protein